MKIGLLLFFVLSAEIVCNPKGAFPFIKATSQQWAGGAAATHGTYYKIYLSMQKNPDYSFDSLWVNDKRLAVEVLRNNSADTLVLFSNDYSGIRNPETQEQIESTAAKLPINTNAEAVLGYF